MENVRRIQKWNNVTKSARPAPSASAVHAPSAPPILHSFSRNTTYFITSSVKILVYFSKDGESFQNIIPFSYLKIKYFSISYIP